jgi:hypothetical protein
MIVKTYSSPCEDLSPYPAKYHPKSSYTHAPARVRSNMFRFALSQAGHLVRPRNVTLVNLPTLPSNSRTIMHLSPVPCKQTMCKGVETGYCLNSAGLHTQRHISIQCSAAETKGSSAISKRDPEFFSIMSAVQQFPERTAVSTSKFDGSRYC